MTFTVEERLASVERRVDTLVEIIRKMYDIQTLQEQRLDKLHDAIVTVSQGTEKHMKMTGDLAQAIAILALPAKSTIQ